MTYLRIVIPVYLACFQVTHRRPRVVPPGTAVTRSDNISQDVDMATIRLNYRFGGPIVAKY
jgi:hypothetical protein